MLRSKHVLGRIFCLSLAVLCLTGYALAQFVPNEATDSGLGGSNSVTGTVQTASGRLTRRIVVRLTTMTRGDRIASTDDNGNFSFRGLTSGDYSIVIDKEKDFEPFTQTFTIIQLRGSPPQVYTVNVRLKHKASSEPKPGLLDVATANLPERGRTLYTKAQELARVGDHKGSAEQLMLLTTEFPDFMLGFNELGVSYLRQNELEKAEAAFLAAIKIEPEAYQPLMNRGIVLVTMKRFAEAESVLRSAVKAREDSAVARYFLGQAVANLGRFDEAEQELSSAIKLGGDEMKEAHRLLAIIYSAKGDKKRAAGELETYLRLAPTAPDADQIRKVILQFKGVAEPTPAVPSSTKPGL